ncbi:MAG: hypothetical protein DCE90_17735 [Pseudanabaena sp.]|nr:MAG: hypothetical protein DCE90_17735 [Pseudanabaena sp.]
MTKNLQQHKYSQNSEQLTDITSGSINKAQEVIYDFFLAIIKSYRPEDILDQFNRLFILYEEVDNISAYYALGEIIFHNKELEFKNTLLRCCYILNNNWAINSNIEACRQLADLFLTDSIGISTKITKLRTLRSWLQNFVQSDDYNTLRSLSGRSSVYKHYYNWSERFSSYLLTLDYTNYSKSQEQREYAENLSRKLKKQFKFDLALYTARLDSKSTLVPQQSNPTSLGNDVLILVKRILNKQGSQNFRNNAKAFYQQARNMSYFEFKESLLKYIGISSDNLDTSEVIRVTVVQKLMYLQKHRDHEEMNKSFLFITLNRVLQYLLLNERRQPSDFLQLSLESNNYLTPVIFLIKTILIVAESRVYLESHIAELIRFYSSYNESECRSFINFLDVLNVTLAIFDDDTNYSLIKMKNAEAEMVSLDLDHYRIFSQVKSYENLPKNLTNIQNTTQTLPPSFPNP